MPAKRSKRALPNTSNSRRITARVACPQTCPSVPSTAVGGVRTATLVRRRADCSVAIVMIILR